MKKILLLLGVLLLISSCTLDDDRQKFAMAFLPAVDVDAPEFMEPGHTYDITVKYNRPTDCYYFDGFYHELEGNAHIIAVQALVIQDAECKPLETLLPEEATFQMSCPSYYQGESYLFKFYQGEDEQGNQQFREVVIPVQQ